MFLCHVLLGWLRESAPLFFFSGHLDQWAASSSLELLFEENCELDKGLQDRVWAFLAMRIKLLLASYPTKKEVREEACLFKNAVRCL